MLDARHDRPLYRQLTDQLRLEVARLQPGARIASEPELALAHSVSRFTVTKAVEALVDEGLVVRRQGKGTFVAAPPLKRAPIHLRSFTEAVMAEGRQPTSDLLSFGPVDWRVGFPYDPSESLIGLERLRRVDGTPIAIHRSVLSAALVAETGLTEAKAAEPHFSLYRFYEDAGLRIDHGFESLAARKATPSERKRMRLDADGIVIVVTRCSFRADGRVLDAVEAVHDSRRYVYQALLQRDPDRAVRSMSNEVGDRKDV